MEKKTDIRIVKTERVITRVFLELMSEIGFSKINVQKIIDRAEINRSTFYAHYIDKFDLLKKTEDNLLIGIKNIASDAPSEIITTQDFNDERIIQLLDIAINYLHDNGKVFTLLMSNDPAFINKVGKMITSIWTEKNIIDRLSIPQSYLVAALFGMMSGLISEWVKSDFRESPEEFKQIILKLGKDIPKNVFNKV